MALLQAVGRAVSLPEDLLGATVLAWGQGIPDLVAAVSVAQSGAWAGGGERNMKEQRWGWEGMERVEVERGWRSEAWRG